MSGRARGIVLPRAIDSVLREFVNALGKAAMYPAGHRFIAESAGALVERLGDAMQDRDSITIGILPRGLLLDGLAVDPLPAVLRDFAVRMHRKNIGTIYLMRGVSAADVATLLGALSAADADETIGRQGLRLERARVEPMVYDVLGFGDPLLDRELDDVFWVALVEAAFGKRLQDGEPIPTAAQLADAISETAAQGADGARRVYEALAAFSSAIATRADRAPGSARRRFVEVLSALSRPTTTRVVAAAPNANSRRRFLRETLEIVPPALLMQLLESVAEADGEPISPQLRWLLGKLAGGEGIDAPVGGAFANEVLGLVQQWDGIADETDEETDPRLGIEPARVLAAGIELEISSEIVTSAARRLTERGQLNEVLQLLDNPQNDLETVNIIADAVLDPGLMERLLAEPELDFAVIERVAHHAGAASTSSLLDALAAADERTTRRRLLDILAKVGPEAEEILMARLRDAPWYLARNILAVLTQFPAIHNIEPVFIALNEPELRVRQEALKVLLRQPQARERAITEALESGEESLARMGLVALGADCPPRLVSSVLTTLGQPSPELQLQAIRVLSGTPNPLVVPHLLVLVRARRRWFGRQRLLPKSAVMLAALELLARRWSSHRPVLTTMQLASKSSDPEIRNTVGARA